MLTNDYSKSNKVEFQNYPLLLKDFNSPDLVEKKFIQQTDYGIMRMHSWSFKGIRMRYVQNQYNDYYTFVKYNDIPLVALSFNLKGHFKIQQQNKTYHTAPNQHNILYMNGVENTFQNLDLETSSFSIDFTPEAFEVLVSESNPILQNFTYQMQKESAIVLSQNSIPIDQHLSHLPHLSKPKHSLTKAIQDILDYPYTGGLKQLFLHSKAIEILVLQGEAYYHFLSPNNKNEKRKSNIAKLLHAREYLINHMAEPPSLPELSKIVGLNEYQLKKRFQSDI